MVRTFSQLDDIRTNSLPYRDRGQVPIYSSHPASNRLFPFPTPPLSQSTKDIRIAGLQARADITGAACSVPASFEQLTAAMLNENFISALGRHAVDDPARIDKLTLANVRQNPLARNSLASLHSARTCIHGARQLGDRKWYSDKPGIANRLKTHTQRRQFRMGFVANLTFYNQLNIQDFQSLFFFRRSVRLGSSSQQHSYDSLHVPSTCMPNISARHLTRPRT